MRPLGVALLSRVLAELQMTADECAQVAGVERHHIDAYVADPASTPYPVRISLATALEQRATTAEQRELGRLLHAQTIEEVRAYGALFGASLSALPLAEALETVDRWLAESLVRHPCQAPMTCTQDAQLLGVDVNSYLERWRTQ